MDKKLIATLPAGNTKEFELVRPVYTIGRDPECDIPVDHGSLSRTHAKILVTEASCLLSDLGSRNGSYVNGERVHGEVELKDGDEVRCGSIAFKYADSAAQAAAPLGLRPKKEGLASVLASDMEIGEKFRQSTKLLTYGVILPTLNWRLRLFLFVLATIAMATLLVLLASGQADKNAEERRLVQLMNTFMLENRVVFEQGLPYYGNLSVRDEKAIVESYLLGADGYPVFPPDRKKVQVMSIGNRPLASITELSRIPGPSGTRTYVAPIYSAGRPRGYAVATYDPARRSRSAYTEGAIIVGALFVTVVGFVAMSLASRIISRPLKNFEEEIELMTSGQASQLSTYGGFPELNAIVKTIYLLIVRLRSRQG